MIALVTGSRGQLGVELARTAPDGCTVVGVDLDELDVTDAEAVDRAVAAHKPQVIVNGAAFTDVDGSEKQEALATRVNGEAPGHVARAAARHGARLVHISTDFVFDGTSGRPYAIDAAPAPQSAYGRSKLAGERAVLHALPTAAVIRTAWLYASHGRNFVRTMLRLMRERGAVRVVADQVGTPTWARHLAQAVWRAADRRLSGIHHFTDAGVASWYDFAVAIAEEAAGRGLLAGPATVSPIPTSAFPTPATRPSFSVLDKSATWSALGWTPPHWRDGLRACLDLLDAEGNERPNERSGTANAPAPRATPAGDRSHA